jgi:hypothetical protein
MGYYCPKWYGLLGIRELWVTLEISRIPTWEMANAMGYKGVQASVRAYGTVRRFAYAPAFATRLQLVGGCAPKPPLSHGRSIPNMVTSRSTELWKSTHQSESP